MSGPEELEPDDPTTAQDAESAQEGDGATESLAVIADIVRSALPGAELASWALTARRLREEVIGGDLFSDPAWDILLDLYAARDRGDRVQVTSIASIAGVPPSTGRRWAKRLVDRGLLERERDRRDQRQTFMRLTPKGEEIMTAFMVRLAEKGMPPLLRN